MRRVNQAIIRERFPIPTVEETLQELQGATYFSKLDLKWGYHQIEISPESRSLTTFSIQEGLFRYKRLIFGMSDASELCQRYVQQSFSDISNCRNISDDIIVFGKTLEDESAALEEVLKRAQEIGITFNPAKCIFHTQNIDFFGYKLSPEGISPDTSKLEAVHNFSVPTNNAELKSFLGLVSYLSKFIPHFADRVEPLRELLRKNVSWEWTEKQKNLLSFFVIALLISQPWQCLIQTEKPV